MISASSPVRRFLPCAPLAFCALPVWASDPTGMLSFLYLFPLGIWVLMAATVVIPSAASGTYASELKAGRHTLVAAIVPAIGLFIALIDHRGADDLILFVACNGFGLLVALIPIVTYRLTDPSARVPHPP